MSNDKKLAPSIRDPNSVFERESRRIADNFNSAPMSNGVLLANIQLGTNTTNVPHRLGRPYRGFFVVDKTAAVDVYRDTGVTTQLNDIIPLKATGTCTVSLWVF